MRLSFASSYLSIHAFPDVDLPNFTLITGPNGAGKSHLLQALSAGNIKADCAPNQNANNRNEVRLFDWNTLVPQDTGMFSSESLRSERANAYNQHNQLSQNPSIAEAFRKYIRQTQLPAKYLSDFASAATLSLAEIENIVGEQLAEDTFEKIRQGSKEFEETFLRQLDSTGQANFRATAEAAGRPLVALTQTDFLSTSVPSWGQVDVFQQSFARLFVAYRDMQLSNQLGQYQASKGVADAVYVSDSEFLRLNGLPPWDFVNESLSTARLDFRINKPELNDFAPFQPELTKITSGVKIPFSALSSGEKVLMSFAFCVYYSNDRRQLSVQPKLILFDEVDAPLHPSMSKNLIATVQETLVNSFGIPVIATTHSPSTVAMAPETAVFVMRPGAVGLQKTSRAEALNILTDGVPTLAISFDGRRQVFVESPTDAKAYDAIYKILKAKIPSERSLEFIATGLRSASGKETNTGSELVKKLVTDLSDAGNRSVFGLLDWDGHHVSSPRIAVLAERKRNGLENLVFDPLAIGLLICRDFAKHKSSVGILDKNNYISVTRSDPAALQTLVDIVSERIFRSPRRSADSVEYVGGLCLDVDSRYLTTDDHELEAKLLDAFPFLRAVSRQTDGRLLLHVIQTVFSDTPDFIPVELKDVILDLLERPSHADTPNMT